MSYFVKERDQSPTLSYPFRRRHLLKFDIQIQSSRQNHAKNSRKTAPHLHAPTKYDNKKECCFCSTYYASEPPQLLRSKTGRETLPHYTPVFEKGHDTFG